MPNEPKPTSKRQPMTLKATAMPGESEDLALAKITLDPAVQAAVTLNEYGKVFGELDLSGLIESLTAQTKAVADGDLRRSEAMLTTQAHTLDAQSTPSI